MLYGQTYVYQCPHCSQFLTRNSLLSGNTFGSILYSDGKRISPMLPEFPDLTKCKKCGTLFWLSKLKETGSYEWGGSKKKEWLSAEHAEFPAIADLMKSLDIGIAENKKEEIFIRIHIWWAYNDRVRAGEEMFINDDDESDWRKNLTSLLTLFDQSDVNQLLMSAEIYRNLGDFSNCEKLIAGLNEKLAQIKEVLQKECARKNKLVVKLSA